MNEAKPPRPVSRRERDQMSEAALNRHADRIHAASRGGVVEFAQALADSFADADDARRAETERRRAEWESSPEYARRKEIEHSNRSEGGRRGWQTRQTRQALRDRERPLGGFGAAGANTPVAVDDVCDESLLRGLDACPGTVLNLCGGCADGPTAEQVDQALGADAPDSPRGARVRAWLTAVFPRVTDRMVADAVRAGDRYDRALDRLWGRPLVNVDDADQHQRRVGVVLAAAHRAKDLPELPELGDGPRVHAYTPATPTGPGRHLLGNLSPTRYELLQQEGGALVEQAPAAPTDAVPASARRVLAAAHAAGLAWDLTLAEHAVRLVLHGLGSPGARDTWQWRSGRLDRLHTTGRPLREALAALTDHVGEA